METSKPQRPRGYLSEQAEASDEVNQVVTEFFNKNGVVVPPPVTVDDSSVIKITALQSATRRDQHAARYLDEFLTLQKEREGRVADLVILPEDWLGGRGEVRPDDPTLKLLSEVVARHSVYALLGTMHEIDGPKVYVTAVLMNPDGSILGSYRKRKPTIEGAHDVGTQVGIFDTRFGKIGVMICFDIENEDILHETLAHDPYILLNPTWIPHPPIMKNPKDSMSLSTWRTGMETMSRLFEQRCVERGMNIVRCDMPFPGALGSSQFISPCFTSYVSCCQETAVTGYIPRDADCLQKNNFTAHIKPPETQRTDRKDRVGSRYTIRSYPGHQGSILDVKLLDPIMKAASASSDKTIKVWNVNTTECLKTLSTPSPVLNLLAPKAKRDCLWSCSMDGALTQWNIVQWKSTFSSPEESHADIILRLHEGQEQGSLVCGCVNGKIKLFDTNSCAFTQSFESNEDSNPILSIATQDSYILAGTGNVVQVWDIRNNSRPVAELKGHNGSISSVQGIDGTQHVLSASFDGSVRLWDLSTSGCIGVTESELFNGNAVTGAAVLGSDSFVASSVDGTLRLFKWAVDGNQSELALKKAELLHTFRAHTGPVMGLGYNGKERLFSFGQENEWRMWFITQDRHAIVLKDMLLPSSSTGQQEA